MKIAFINQSIRGGGAERATVNLANRLSEKKDTELFLVTGPVQENEYNVSSQVQRMSVLRINLFSDIVALRKVFKENKIDVAVGMGIYSNLCVCIANFGIKTKIIISERNSPAHDHISKKSKLLRFLFYRNADAYVFQTQQARQFYSKVIQKRGVVIHNPVKSDLPDKSHVNNKEIVAVGRLMPQKNYNMLLDAMKKVIELHPEYILRIFGVGNDLEKLQEKSKKIDVEKNVVFEGFCLNVHEQIQDSEIFVMSSDFEGMPNSLMEAMAMGFPVVTTDCPCGGPSELIADGENGILVPVGDCEKMAEAIIHVIEDKELSKKISVNAKDIIRTHNDSVIVDSWMDLFCRILFK